MKNKIKRNLLVTLADKNYVEQAKQLFSSVYWNAGWKGDYMLLSHEIPEKKLKWFRKKGILIKKCKPLNFPDMRLSKFYLFTPEFKKWKNIVFLDADIIVKASIKDLTKIKGFYAVHDFFPKIKDQFPFKKRDKNLYKEFKIKYNFNEDAFNSGAIAFSTDIIEKNSFSELKILTKYIIFSHTGEQGILNLLFYKKWKELPLVFNFNPFLAVHPYLTKKGPRIKGIIMHFPGSRKPWNSKYSFYYREWKLNLDKAELINIKNPIKKTRKYSEEEIQKYSKYLRKRIFLYSPINFLDKAIGLFGVFLKKKIPKIYYKLKSLQLKYMKIS